MDNLKVSAVRCENYDSTTVKEALNKTFDILGGIKRFITPGMKVVLKPNLVMEKSPDAAATTHPRLIAVLSSMLIDAGASVTIADSPGGPYTHSILKGVYEKCGITNAMEKSGAILNYDTSEISIDNPEAIYLKTLTVLKPLIEADMIINLPKLKTHGQMVYTGAVKNMYGAIPGTKKSQYHFLMAEYNRFADTLIDVFISVKPNLNIMDAVTGMDGQGPTAGDPRHIGLLLASENAFALDLTALKIINVKPSDVPVITQGIKRGLCPTDMSNIQICGEPLENIMVKDFNVPQLSGFRNIQFTNNIFLKKIFNHLKSRPVFLHEHCTGCSKCSQNCPAGIIEMKNNRPYADISKCIGCFCCQELCPEEAIIIKTPLLNKIVFNTIGFFIYKFRSVRN
jgi:uncharacterized protein (DUF362 family)/Pyruvate/2-oxoacid:ferredoxin oxidoreductase delta subunit